MERTEWTLGADDADRRLERILRRVLRENSKGAVESVLRKGLVKLNGKKAASSAVTKEGDRLSAASFLLRPELLQKSGQNENAAAGRESGAFCNSAAPALSGGTEKEEGAFDSPGGAADAIPWPVVFKNEHLLLLDKPEGVPVHGSGSVAEYFSSRKNPSLAFVPAPLHRLDKGTSGLLAVSMSLKGAVWFSERMRERSIKKFYWGIVSGNLPAEELWEDLLEEAEEPGRPGFLTPRAVQKGAAPGKNPPGPLRAKSAPSPKGGAADGKKSAGASKAALAKTAARPLRRGLFNGAPITLAEFQIFTGKKRQIRAQCAAHGLPLLGDRAYGQAGPRFYLRAVRMEFPPNDLGIPAAVVAPERPWQRLF